MQKFLLLIVLFLLCVSCGVKSEPEYKSQIGHNKTIRLV